MHNKRDFHVRSVFMYSITWDVRATSHIVHEIQRKAVNTVTLSKANERKCSK